MSDVRRATLPALAKINLDLRVIGKRADGYHELRTIFQTDLARRFHRALVRGGEAHIHRAGRSAGDPGQPGGARGAPRTRSDANCRTCRDPAEEAHSDGRRIGRRIVGCGGDPAGLPVLAGGEIALPRLMEFAQQLGSDVPFFLFGGRAAAIGRGTELFPLPDLPTQYGLLAAPGVHVSTPEAYRALGARLTNAVTPK